MCRLLHVVTVLQLMCVHSCGRSNISFTKYTSLYQAIRLELTNTGLCHGNSQFTIICANRGYSHPCATHQGHKQREFCTGIFIHLQEHYLCCKICSGIFANMPGEGSVFLPRVIYPTLFKTCVQISLSDISFVRNDLLNLLVFYKGIRFEPLEFNHCDAEAFDNNHFMFLRGEEKFRSVQSRCDMCHVSAILVLIVLCALHQRFVVCFLSILYLVIGTYCHLPETFNTSKFYPGENKTLNKSFSSISKNTAVFRKKNSSIIQHKPAKLSSELQVKGLRAHTHHGENKSADNSAFAGMDRSDTSESRDRVVSQTTLTPDSAKNEATPRSIRSAGGVPPARRSCGLHLVADHLFFRQVGQGNMMTTVRVMSDVIEGVDAIFRSTDFDQDGVEDNIGFVIQNITLLQTYPSAFFSYTVSSTDYVQYLRNFSRADHSPYCLAIIFTTLPFKGGVWGVAWTASSSSDATPGGICQQRVFLKQEGAEFSFNTAAITFGGEGQRLSTEAAIRILAHELGHSFGSSHDDDDKSACSFNSSQTARNGVYMMYQYVTTGRLPNHKRFSPCSLRLMYPVIVHKGNCLHTHHTSQCGNVVVEKGEECDCGNSDVCDYIDPCCTPSDVIEDSQDYPCTVRRSQGKTCSPLSGSCCLSTCQVTRNSSVVCDTATECHQQAVCNGQNGTCPQPASKRDGTLCRGGSRFCVAGQCTGDVCRSHGLLACQCVSPEYDQCKLCCKATENSKCLSSDKHGIRNDQGHPVYLISGEPCGGVSSAFCDSRHECVHYAITGRLSIFIAPIKWGKKYWLYVVILVVFVLLIVLFNMSPARLNDAHMQALHYGKLLGIFQTADCIGVQNMRDIAVARYLFDKFWRKTAKGKLQMYYVEAVNRLSALFPTCPLFHIISAVEMGSNEDAVVRVLLAQGYPLRRFVPKISQSKFAHLAHLLPRPAGSLGIKRGTSTIFLDEIDRIHRLSENEDTSVDPHTRSEFSMRVASESSAVGVHDPHHEQTLPSDYGDIYLQHFQEELTESRHHIEKVVSQSSHAAETAYGGTDYGDPQAPLSTSVVPHSKETEIKATPTQTKLHRGGILKSSLKDKKKKRKKKKGAATRAGENVAETKEKTGLAREESKPTLPSKGKYVSAVQTFFTSIFHCITSKTHTQAQHQDDILAAVPTKDTEHGGHLKTMEQAESSSIFSSEKDTGLSTSSVDVEQVTETDEKRITPSRRKMGVRLVVPIKAQTSSESHSTLVQSYLASASAVSAASDHQEKKEVPKLSYSERTLRKLSRMPGVDPKLMNQFVNLEKSHISESHTSLVNRTTYDHQEKKVVPQMPCSERTLRKLSRIHGVDPKLMNQFVNLEKSHISESHSNLVNRTTYDHQEKKVAPQVSCSDRTLRKLTRLSNKDP